MPDSCYNQIIIYSKQEFTERSSQIMRGRHKLISAILCVCFLVSTLPQCIVPVIAAEADIATSSATSLTVAAPTFAPVMVGYGQPKAEPITIKNIGSGYIHGVKAEVSGDSFMLTGPAGTLFLIPGGTDTSYSIQPKPGLPEGTYTATITVTSGNSQSVSASVSFEVKPTGSIVNPPDGVPAADAPQNLTELRSADPAEVAKVSRFDSRNYGIVPPTKDQGASNICWAYAPITASTISILRSGIDPHASKDSLWLSPEVLAYSRHNHMADPLGNTTAEITGDHWFSSPGDTRYTPPLLSQWCGPVLSNSSLMTDPRINPFTNAAYKMENAVTVESTQLRTDMIARNAIKEAIVKYGAVTFSYNNIREVQYYNPTSEPGSNTSLHACTVIGWDDTISADQFKPGKASQPGGWLVKNSYDSLPYFWLSYDCHSSTVWAFDYAPADRYDYNYFYDSSSVEFGLAASAIKNTAANVFLAKKGTDQTPEYLKAVNVGFSGKNVHCEVKVYSDLTDSTNPESGQCVATVQGDYALSGYYTLQLDQPVTLTPNSYFSVVVKVSSNSGGSPWIWAGLNSSSHSYVKNSSGDWGAGPARAVRIKAFTKLGDPGDVPSPTIDISSAVVTLPADSFVYTGNQITPDCMVTVNNQSLTPGTDYTVSYSDNTDIGTATVTVTGTGSYHGSVSKTFAITKASFTAAVSLNDWTYGQTASDPVVSGNTSGGVVSYWYAASETGTYSTIKPTNAGTYYIKAQIEATLNYDACTTTPVRFTIHKASEPSNYPQVPKTAVLKHNESLSAISLPSGWSWSNPSQTITPGTTVPVSAEYFDQDNYQTATATVQITKEQPPAPILTPETTPSATIDYIAEALCGLVPLGIYEINGTTCTIGKGGTLPIDSAWLGNTLTIVKVGNGTTTKNSAPQMLSIPNRPAAPQNLNVIHEDFAGNHNGQISGVSVDMEYQISSSSWTACVGNSITNLAPDTYLIRTKATDHSFAGLSTTVNIKPGKVPSYTLTLTAPVFSAVTVGYQQPEALPIMIVNSGNHDATISSAVLSGENANNFVLLAGNNTVASGAQNTSYSIQPKENLPVGSYTAQIMIQYDGGAQAQAEISFTVRAQPVQPTPNPGGTTYYSIRVAPSPNGTISVSPQRAAKGTKVTLTASPDAGYALSDLILQDSKGGTIALTKESATAYTFAMPGSPVTVAAVFTRIESPINFTDVNPDSYYYDAVAWAVKQEITMGTSATTFSPDAACTRAQMVTFLWRAAGSPSPGAATCNFTDVDKDSDSYQAILWAAERGITIGTSKTTFQPTAVCSRGQMATFLYRYSGSPAVTGTHPFADVPDNTYYHDAVTWAAQTGVTRGTSATTFSPADNCTRGQMITFLHRLLGK